ncbi:MAG: polysaccharide deacetylase family protein [Lachnospiraceae bacterium]
MHKSKKIVLLVGIIIIILGIVFGYAWRNKGNALRTEISPVKYGRNAIVTIVSDDGDFETGVNLDELANKYGFTVTVSGIVNYIEPHLEEWRNIVSRGNVELVPHSYTHSKLLNEKLSAEEMSLEVCDSIDFVEENFSIDLIAFVPPEGVIDMEAYKLLEQNGINVVRGVKYGYNTLEPQEGYEESQWYNLRVISIWKDDSTEERNEWIDIASNENKWLIEMWHNVTQSGTNGGYEEISYEQANEHMSYIAEMQQEEKIWVASLTEASKYLLEKENATVSATYSNSKIRVKLKCDKKKVPPEVYNGPLTIKVFLPEIAGNILSLDNQDNDQVRVKEENGETYLEFEMIPDSEVTISLDENGYSLHSKR